MEVEDDLFKKKNCLENACTTIDVKMRRKHHAMPQINKDEVVNRKPDAENGSCPRKRP